MRIHLGLPATLLALSIGPIVLAQGTLKDGTTLYWDKQIIVAEDSLRNDSITVPALSIPVYEGGASQVTDLLKKALTGASFKKQGSLLKIVGSSFGSYGTPLDMLAKVTGDKKTGHTKISLAFLRPGTSTTADLTALRPAVRQLGVDLNKAVVQGQINVWKKKLDLANSRTSSAAKDQDKAQDKLTRSQAQLERTAREKSKLQAEHAAMQKKVHQYNQKWSLSQHPKDLKKLTKARGRIQKNEARMAKAMETEAKAQKDLSRNTASLPGAQKAKETKAAEQAEMQRTVDALQRKWESIK